jgi:DNA-binding response OmpR family regulator
MQVLLVEDDDRVAAALQNVLSHHGFSLTRADGVGTALKMLDDSIDLVLLDLMLPDGDGLSLCARIRSARDVPIVITTARGELSWRVHGLNLGADDYVVKPYDLRELMARMRAVIRRAQPALAPDDRADNDRVLSAQGVQIDLRRHRVTVHGAPVSLTRKEFALLEELALSPGLVVRREQLLSRVWQSMYEPDGHTLNVHVATMRAKLGVPELIQTVRGVGYRLALD